MDQLERGIKLGPGERVIIKNTATLQWTYATISEMVFVLGCLICYGERHTHEIWLPEKFGHKTIRSHPTCFTVAPDALPHIVELWTLKHGGLPLYIVEFPLSIQGVALLNRGEPKIRDMGKDDLIKRAVGVIKEFRGVSLS